MQRFKCTVKLAGSVQHVVTNKGPITVAEIAVLRRIHGDDAVSDFAYVDNIKVNANEERERLRLLYDTAALGDSEPVVDQCFGVMGPLPQSLSDIGISAKSQSEALREKARQALEEADKLEGLDETSEEDPDALDTLFEDEVEEV